MYQSSFDWRVQGSKVQIQLNVHDQGLQGGGIVHAAVGALEEHYQIKYQATLGVPAKTFSVQQGLDCLHPDKMPKMSTGDVYKFFMNQGGLATKKAYPDTPD